MSSKYLQDYKQALSQPVTSHYRWKYTLTETPKKIRTKDIKGKHFALALQGGGAKGLAYIGAYKAMQEHYGTNFPLKSVIGSSAGSVLGLDFACGLDVEVMEEQCINYLRKM